MARLLLQNLQLQGVKDITVVCRSRDKVVELQEEIRQTTLHYRPMEDLTDAIANADILFPCTSAPEPIITPNMLQLALTPTTQIAKNGIGISSSNSISSGSRYGQRVGNPFLSTLQAPNPNPNHNAPSSSSSSNSRAGKLNSPSTHTTHTTNTHSNNNKASLQIVDISVPLNVHKDCNLPSSQLGVSIASYNVDDLKSIMAQNAAMRRNEVKEAEKIISDEVEVYLNSKNNGLQGKSLEGEGQGKGLFGLGLGLQGKGSSSCKGICKNKRSFRRG